MERNESLYQSIPISGLGPHLKLLADPFDGHRLHPSSDRHQNNFPQSARGDGHSVEKCPQKCEGEVMG